MYVRLLYSSVYVVCCCGVSLGIYWLGREICTAFNSFEMDRIWVCIIKLSIGMHHVSNVLTFWLLVACFGEVIPATKRATLPTARGLIKSLPYLSTDNETVSLFCFVCVCFTVECVENKYGVDL